MEEAEENHSRGEKPGWCGALRRESRERAGGGTRTPDSRIMIPLLYQLSYAGGGTRENTPSHCEERCIRRRISSRMRAARS